MNRPIKFRVWNKKSNEWCGTIGLNETISHNELEYDTDDLVFVQYTGLKDSKGNEVYEGDIVINTTSEEEYCSPAVIIWGKYEFVGFALAYKCNKLEDYHAPLIHKINGVDLVEEFSLSKMGTYQIIGNASENPELLK